MNKKAIQSRFCAKAAYTKNEKKCHSRGMLSGIYNACCYDYKRKTLLNRYVEDPRLRPSGMTSNLMGFTLIELLVVVLIIGILAAVAVPQYQKAVTKTRYKNMLPILKAVVEAQQVYYLANGNYPTSLDALDVDLPPSSGTCTMNRSTTAVDSKKLGDFCLFLTSDNSVVVSTIKSGQGGRSGYQWKANAAGFGGRIAKGTHLFCITSFDSSTDKHCTGEVVYPDQDWVRWYYMD